jgi:TolA-binding protein
MSHYKKPVIGIALALVVILVGLFLLCAQQRSTVKDSENLSANDEEFRQELLEMLDLSDDQVAGGQVDEVTLPDESENDVLALLTPEKAKSDQPVATEPVSTAENMGLSEDMFVRAKNDVSRLEGLLEKTSSSVDSLKRIVETRNSRIKALEEKLQGYRSARVSGQVSSTREVGRSETVMPVDEFTTRYNQARNLFERYEYTKSIEAMQKLLAEQPNHVLADNCQYWIGECYYGLKQYQKAIIEFQKVFAYSQTDKHDDAQLMIGLSYIRLGQKEKAQTEFQTFLNTYIGSEYTSIARRYMRNI